MSTQIYPVPELYAENSHVNESKYRKMYAEALNDPENFWAHAAKHYLTWLESWEKVLSGGFDPLDVRWFQGGKLNASYNCLDRHLPQRANQTAMIWEGNNPEETRSITYAELHENVCRFANVLKNFGVEKGDRVCIYLPMIPEAAIAMLACTRIGAIHSVVFAGFSPESLKTRIQDADCRIVITANEGLRGKKIIPLKTNVDAALKDNKNVSAVIVVQRTKNSVPWDNTRDHWYHEVMQKAHAHCPTEIMDANDPLFILYTSGSTGQPKGILHGTGGYLVYAAITFDLIFNYKAGETFWCTADIGWITGHTYTLYGPLLNGGTTLFYEGVPNYPTPARFWEIVDKHAVNIFYTAPTAIRALRRDGDEWVKRTDRKSLRLLGTVGEPINPDAWEWYYHVVGADRCPIVDTWWQTETGGIMISPFPGATPLKPGSAAWPFFGVQPLIVDDEGKPLPDNTMGNLVIAKPWPGMMLSIYGDHARFVKTYFKTFPGYYLTGDQAERDDQGYFWIAGRNDDVIKVSGHRIGSEEIESALIHHEAVSESAAIAIPDDIKGHSIYVFVVLNKGQVSSDELKKELINTVRDAIGPIATPQYIQWTEGLPKTRSGKIMRRLLRKIATLEFDNLGDLTTLADPEVVDKLIEERKNMETHRV